MLAVGAAAERPPAVDVMAVDVESDSDESEAAATDSSSAVLLAAPLLGLLIEDAPVEGAMGGRPAVPGLLALAGAVVVLLVPAAVAVAAVRVDSVSSSTAGKSSSCEYDRSLA